MSTNISNLSPTVQIQFTDNAVKEIKNLISKENTPKPLRIGAKNGGCAGFSYIFEFDEPTETDTVLELSGITVVIDPMHITHIQNLSIDFENGLNNRGFTFTNPNAQSTCGCGTSFS
jgi:iron-sulfur cluster assembly protein